MAVGIAHDFNNLLGAITGYADLVADGSSRSGGAGRRGADPGAAAQRGAVIRGWPNFSRRKPVQAVPVDINGVVLGARDLVSASMGADVAARFYVSARVAAGAERMGAAGQVRSAWLSTRVMRCWPVAS